MSQKITDLIKSGSLSCSYEVTPDISKAEIENLNIEPLFYSITWHALNYEFNNLDIPPLKLANYLKRKGKEVLLHISCTNMRKDYINNLLPALQENDICNLFVILGENFDPNESEFASSQKLISYIRQRTGDYFCIGVAGFPHEEAQLLHLKQKVDSGADFILTQAFFECNLFKKFVTKCKEMEINVPIIPGIFPFDNIKELDGFINMCKVHITEDFLHLANTKPGREIIQDLLSDLIADVEIKHFHFFTLNKIQRTTKLVEKIFSN